MIIEIICGVFGYFSFGFLQTILFIFLVYHNKQLAQKYGIGELRDLEEAGLVVVIWPIITAMILVLLIIKIFKTIRKGIKSFGSLFSPLGNRFIKAMGYLPYYIQKIMKGGES
jgi:hypothetical protein